MRLFLSFKHPIARVSNHQKIKKEGGIRTKYNVLAEDNHVEFIDSKEGNKFTVRVSRPLAVSEAVSNDKKAVSSGKKAVSKKEKNEQKLLAFCKEPKTLSEICEHLGMTDRYKVKKRYIDPLLNKSLRMTEPESPKSPTQKYVAI